MPRTAQIDHKSNKIPDLTQPENGGFNGPSREDFLFFSGRLAAADKDIKEAKDRRKKLRQFFANQGVNLAMMDEALAERSREDGTTISNMRELKRYYGYLGLPIGKQLDIFDQPAGNAVAVEEQAYEEGKELGIKGMNPDDQKWLPTTPEGQAHQRGWNDGQAVLLAKIQTLSDGLQEVENAEAAAKAEKEKKKAARAAKKAAKSADADDGEEAAALN